MVIIRDNWPDSWSKPRTFDIRVVLSDRTIICLGFSVVIVRLYIGLVFTDDMNFLCDIVILLVSDVIAVEFVLIVRWVVVIHTLLDLIPVILQLYFRLARWRCLNKSKRLSINYRWTIYFARLSQDNVLNYNLMNWACLVDLLVRVWPRKLVLVVVLYVNWAMLQSAVSILAYRQLKVFLCLFP